MSDTVLPMIDYLGGSCPDAITGYRPIPGMGFVERFVEATDMGVAIIGPFSLGIRVMHQQTEPSAVTGCRPLQHLQIAVGVTERRDGATADATVDGNRLALLVINEVDLRETNDDRIAVAELKLRLHAAANHLLGRNAVDLLGEDTQELNATAGSDHRIVRSSWLAQGGYSIESQPT